MRCLSKEQLTFRKLELADSTKLYSLLQEVESTLLNREYWLPINQISFKHFFDDMWTIFYGAFYNNDLVGASALFLNRHEFGESLEHIDFKGEKNSVVEIGRSMVKPAYRGNNILFDINKRLIQEAEKQNKKYILATIHPNNLPSQKSFEKLGLHKVANYTKSCGYERDVLFGEIRQLIKE